MTDEECDEFLITDKMCNSCLIKKIFLMLKTIDNNMKEVANIKKGK